MCIRDRFNEEEEKYMVEAWKAGDTAEHGAVIAKLDLAAETVEYLSLIHIFQEICCRGRDAEGNKLCF